MNADGCRSRFAGDVITRRGGSLGGMTASIGVRSKTPSFVRSASRAARCDEKRDAFVIGD